MTLKDIKTRFHVSSHKHDGKYLIHSLEPGGSRLVHKYLCSINKNKQGKFFVDGFEPTGNIDVLSKQINDYVSSLEFDSEYYYPLYRPGVFEELFIKDYMTSIGFKCNGNGSYSLKDKNIYNFNSSDITISFNGLDSWKNTSDDKGEEWGGILFDNSKEIEVILHTGRYSWISSKCKRNCKEIRTTIDTILKPLFISDSVDNFNRADKLNDVEDIDLIMNKINDKMELSSGSYKQELKKRLQETLERIS